MLQVKKQVSFFFLLGLFSKLSSAYYAEIRFDHSFIQQEKSQQAEYGLGLDFKQTDTLFSMNGLFSFNMLEDNLGPYAKILFFNQASFLTLSLGQGKRKIKEEIFAEYSYRSGHPIDYIKFGFHLVSTEKIVLEGSISSLSTKIQHDLEFNFGSGIYCFDNGLLKVNLHHKRIDLDFAQYRIQSTGLVANGYLFYPKMHGYSGWAVDAQISAYLGELGEHNTFDINAAIFLDYYLNQTFSLGMGVDWLMEQIEYNSFSEYSATYNNFTLNTKIEYFFNKQFSFKLLAGLGVKKLNTNKQAFVTNETTDFTSFSLSFAMRL